MTVGPASTAGLGALQIYGGDGALLRELSSAAGFDARIAQFRVSAGGRLLYTQPPAPGWRSVLVESRPVDGAAPPPIATQVLIQGRNGTEVVVAGLTAEGSTVFRAALQTPLDWFQLSPGGRYLFGDDGLGTGLVFDTQAQAVVWTGSLQVGIFASDDSAFYAFSGGVDPKVLRHPLPSGPATSHQLPAGVPGSPVGLWPRAAMPEGVIYSTSGNVSFGSFLFLLTPDGRWLPFSQPLEKFSVEGLVGLIDQGRSALFTREPSYGQTTAAPVGTFRLNLSTGVVQKLEVPPGRFIGGVMYASSPAPSPAGRWRSPRQSPSSPWVRCRAAGCAAESLPARTAAPSSLPRAGC